MSGKVLSISISDLQSITTLDASFGTTKYLPAREDIPKEFESSRNPYVRVINAIFHGEKMPDMSINLAPGVQIPLLQRFIRAHLASFEPKHEHKIAGVAYLLSRLCTLDETDNQKAHAPT